jgi:hypothetical protein
VRISTLVRRQTLGTVERHRLPAWIAARKRVGTQPAPRRHSPPRPALSPGDGTCLVITRDEKDARNLAAEPAAAMR